jgi:hypothetical protein
MESDCFRPWISSSTANHGLRDHISRSAVARSGPVLQKPSARGTTWPTRLTFHAGRRAVDAETQFAKVRAGQRSALTSPALRSSSDARSGLGEVADCSAWSSGNYPHPSAPAACSDRPGRSCLEQSPRPGQRLRLVHLVPVAGRSVSSFATSLRLSVPVGGAAVRRPPTFPSGGLRSISMQFGYASVVLFCSRSHLQMLGQPQPRPCVPRARLDGSHDEPSISEERGSTMLKKVLEYAPPKPLRARRQHCYERAGSTTTFAPSGTRS